MKRLFLIALLGVIFLACGGCGPTQMATIQQAIIQFDDANAKRVMDIMAQVMKHWEGNSIFWKIQIGAKLQDEDHYKLRTAWAALDLIHGRYKLTGKLEEKDAFESFSWFLKWGAAGGKELGFTLFNAALKLAAELGIKI